MGYEGQCPWLLGFDEAFPRGASVKRRFGAFVIDEDARQLLRDGVEIHLSPKAFDLLATLIQARPRALSKADLHARLWPGSFVSDASLATLVAELRGALAESARTPRFVRTVHRHGYAFRGDAGEVSEPIGATESRTGFWLIGPFRQIPLTATENVVGRDPQAHVWLDSPSVSRRHARITIDGDRAEIEDLRSKNGTQVRGNSLDTRMTLSDGDEIRFGSITVTFRVWAPDASTKSEVES